MKGKNAFEKSTLKELVERLRGIQELGVAQYTPVVNGIIATRSRDVRHIQHTLDFLLDFACHPAGLELYKRLCRYYYAIDPLAATSYVHAYREMWDTEEAEGFGVNGVLKMERGE